MLHTLRRSFLARYDEEAADGLLGLLPLGLPEWNIFEIRVEDGNDDRLSSDASEITVEDLPEPEAFEAVLADDGFDEGADENEVRLNLH